MNTPIQITHARFDVGLGFQLGDLVTLQMFDISLTAQITEVFADGTVELAFARPDGSFPLDKPVSRHLAKKPDAIIRFS